ncbi:hypothetical protein [Porphyromonas sp.]|uniref:hypothetical protein n=1 Tax=Porphyromonas sp. TaxID=1924944 RepID=UPI0026DB5EE0|nr:hypothetical protein [Porphyromonas sp.]MDO4695783.1 hypothetical protein [Porphyromonas sp.]MDO4771539.1 hypothetical protein [Porphyromonas sp.]
MKGFSPTIATILLYVSFLLIILGSSLYILALTWTVWLFIIGAIGLTSYFLLSSLAVRGGVARERRLNRMGFIGSLFYIVSSGFMYERSNVWVILFAIASIYVMYSLLAKRD